MAASISNPEAESASEPGMHKIFLISELFSVIVSHVAPDDIIGDTWNLRNRPSESHFGLAPLTTMDEGSWSNIKALSLTARLFRESCLDSMWHTQHTLI
ncbi:hypothetical protein EIP91_001585 [Steccherinum ochraceum]|uniref:Uncharacterized protein n=1 Tax=Steccherinum ochraceum TaxID=92696 RepID=A0A4R0RUE7_9APHY|nr:hypothetical protein EIP91_001585 [Steccherinum ochraceum]